MFRHVAHAGCGTAYLTSGSQRTIGLTARTRGPVCRSAVALLAVTISVLRDPSLGMLLALTLVGTPLYIDQAASQYADVPLSFFILSTIALICLHAEHPSDRRILVLAGLTAGCAGWTKNEGLLFVAATAIALLLPVMRMNSKISRRLLAFASGLAGVAGCILAHDPPSDGVTPERLRPLFTFRDELG